MTAPTDPRHRLAFELIVLGRRWRQTLDECLLAAGLNNEASWAPLVHLDNGGDGIRQHDLALRVGLDSSTLVRLLDQLAERGLIERRVDDSDRRARRIFMTEAGRAAVAIMRPVLEAVDLEVLPDFTDDQIEALRQQLNLIDQRLTEAKDRRP